MTIEIKNIVKNYGEKKVIKNFSLTINSGECVGLIGPNGAGKTTLLKIVVDALMATSGEVLIDGKNNYNMKNKIGYLPQYPNFFEWMTAREVLFFMGQLSGLKPLQLKEKVNSLLKRVGLEGEEDNKISTFSGGMKQRLGIAQAILHNPEFIIMDEPVSALDPIGRREILNLITDLKKDSTILFSTHILNDAEEVCERFCILKSGEKIIDSTYSDLMNNNTENNVLIQTGKENKEWISYIKNLPFISKFSNAGNLINISVNDLAQNKFIILESALKFNVDILKFEISKNSLEDIFMRAVINE